MKTNGKGYVSSVRTAHSVERRGVNDNRDLQFNLSLMWKGSHIPLSAYDVRNLKAHVGQHHSAPIGVCSTRVIDNDNISVTYPGSGRRALGLHNLYIEFEYGPRLIRACVPAVDFTGGVTVQGGGSAPIRLCAFVALTTEADNGKRIKFATMGMDNNVRFTDYGHRRDK